ncbi:MULTISPECIES: GNAT family N-acetyltransferase [Bacillus]|uniref:RimJ/RimL family protein N-acetyltransferase n=1 Tax=Bacillus mycoides TaxID=1405 RepID=A0A3D9VGR5_BACMY|nr:MULTISPECIES: GNAT family N-acetyltransferase [Bacillus]RBP30210.1 RimJ/RimL family protein N-acetyltransferase [Bacillus sp. DB-2]REF39853.1 RimJ/RimL family protein N-acetyltransferase [Bacillus mycoides]
MESISKSEVKLRDIIEEDLPIFFEQQLDSTANYMAAFTAKDPTDKDSFFDHWKKNIADETITIKTILFNGIVTGHVSNFEQFGEPEVSYWIGKEYWGHGIATLALSEFLEYIKIRPLYARSAKDNLASIRGLEKCGFKIISEDKGFSNARGKDVEEFILKLEPYDM